MYRRPHLPTPKATLAERRACKRNAAKVIRRAALRGWLAKTEIVGDVVFGESVELAYGDIAKRNLDRVDRDKAARCYAAIERSYRS